MMRKKHFRMLSMVLALALLAFATAAEPTDWPHPRGGLQGLGVADVTLHDSYEPAWTYKTGGAVLSSPIIVDGVVYSARKTNTCTRSIWRPARKNGRSPPRH